MDIRNFSELLADWPGPSAEPPVGWVERALTMLRAALVMEMRRRGLWHSPPRYLGVVGASRWPEGLDELVVDAYAFVFVERLSALRAQRLVRDHVDGVVLCSLRHFLHERQLDSDRLGYLAFDAVRSVIAEQLGEGKLVLLAGDASIRNDSVLAFSAETAGEPAAAETLAELAEAWNDVLLPEVLTGHGRGRTVVTERLRRLVAELPAHGIEVFRFRDLIEPLKADLRRRWAATLEHESTAELADDRSQHIFSSLAATYRRQLDFAERQSFRKLVHCVYHQVESLGGDESMRFQLRQLWSCLHGWATGGNEERTPSQRGLAAFLGVSRERAEELLRRLREFVATCQQLLAGRVAELGPRRVPV